MNAQVAVELAEASIDAPGGIEVWLVPSAFAAIEADGRELADEARVSAGLPRSEKALRKLLILLDDDPESSGSGRSLRLSDIASGRVSPAALGARLAALQNVTGPNPSS